jgi:hypothetical protein
MKQSTIQWHLARDNQLKLARFCEKHKIRSVVTPPREYDGESYFTICYKFDNEASITAELRAGDTRGYTVADHFQVIDYEFGKE